MATTYRLSCCPLPSANQEDHDHDHFNPPSAIGQRANRVFTPSELPKYGTPTDPPSEITFYDNKKHITQLRHSTSYSPFQSKVEDNTLVISIDGKTRREGSTLAQAVAERHFGPGSEWNGTSFTPRQTPQTAERAVIVGAGTAPQKLPR